MSIDFISMFEQLAEHGTAPDEGCSLYGVGYEEPFRQLEARYIVERFARGTSGEKFVIGPYGSGKTHFLRQLMEIARSHDCVTIEVNLVKSLDYTQPLIVYKEMARRIRAPGVDTHGLAAVIGDILRRMQHRAEANGLPADDILDGWIMGLKDLDLASPAFGRVLQRSLQEYRAGNQDLYENGIRWLAGEVTDRVIARSVGEAPMSAAEVALHAQHAKLSLYCFLRHAGYRGTVVGFDEAEQSIGVERKKMAKCFSHLLAEINALVALKGGAALVVYAMTNDIVDKIDVDMPMLRQRFADPAPGQGFFDGNVLAAKIDLTKRGDPVEELSRIGTRLAEVFFDHVADADAGRRHEGLSGVRALAEEVEREEPSSSARREMVKRVCAGLVNSYRRAGAPAYTAPQRARDAEV